MTPVQISPTLMVSGQDSTLDTLRTICSTRAGFVSSADPAFLRAAADRQRSISSCVINSLCWAGPMHYLTAYTNCTALPHHLAQTVRAASTARQAIK